MFVTKILEKKGVIQAFGVAMIAAPFVNTLTKLYIAHEPSQRTFDLYWQYLVSKTFLVQILSVLTVLNGLLMLQGKTSAWRSTLVVLGAYIVNQIATFKESYAESWVALLYLVINILLFAFIVDQLVWKVEPISPRAASPAKNKDGVGTLQSNAPRVATEARPQDQGAVASPPRSPTGSPPAASTSRSLQSRKKILLHLTELGSWAQVTEISNRGFRVKCLLPEGPRGIDSRMVEFKMRNGPLLKARLSKHQGQDYFFEYVSPSSTDLSALNRWLKEVA